MEYLLTTDELAKKLRITRQQVAEYRKAGMPYLGSGRVFRYILSECVDWLRKDR